MRKTGRTQKTILNVVLGLGLAALFGAVIVSILPSARSYSGPGHRKENSLISPRDKERALSLERQGDAALKANDFTGAKDFYGKSLKINPYHGSTWRSMALVDHSNMKTSYEKFMLYSRFDNAEDREALVRYAKLCAEVGDTNGELRAKRIIESIDSRIVSKDQK